MANQRERQKRRGKKQARREKRLAKKVIAYRHSLPLRAMKMMELPKMSTVLAEFAEPLLAELGPNATALEWRGVLLLASTVWNMIRYADERCVVTGEEHAYDMEQELLDQLTVAARWPREQCEAVVAELEDRKRSLFPDDPRIVVDIRTVDTENGVHVSALSKL
jgi:hypothetical protein